MGRREDWLIRYKHANNMFVHRNGGWTHDKAAAARYSDTDKAKNHSLSNVVGGEWFFDDTTLKDVDFSLDICRDNINAVAKAMALLGMSEGADKLINVIVRIDEAQGLLRKLR